MLMEVSTKPGRQKVDATPRRNSRGGQQAARRSPPHRWRMLARAVNTRLLRKQSPCGALFMLYRCLWWLLLSRSHLSSYPHVTGGRRRCSRRACPPQLPQDLRLPGRRIVCCYYRRSLSERSPTACRLARAAVSCRNERVVQLGGPAGHFGTRASSCNSPGQATGAPAAPASRATRHSPLRAPGRLPAGLYGADRCHDTSGRAAQALLDWLLRRRRLLPPLVRELGAVHLPALSLTSHHPSCHAGDRPARPGRRRPPLATGCQRVRGQGAGWQLQWLRVLLLR